MSSLTVKLANLTQEGPIEPPPSQDWLLGEAFAFYTGEDDAIIKANGGSIVSLAHTDKFAVGAGAEIQSKAVELAIPDRTAVSTDKDLYLAHKDRVRVLVHSPHRGGEALPLRLTRQGATFAEAEVKLDKNGLALYTCRDLPEGHYEAAAEGARTTFQVSSYRLPPLYAISVKQDIEDGSEEGPRHLSFEARLESFGLPFNGKVSVVLLDVQNMPAKQVGAIESLTADSRGQVRGKIALVGEGPFSLVFQAKKDLTRRATLSVASTRVQERPATILSGWGGERFARLLDFDGSTELRGLFCGSRKNPRNRAPIKVEKVVGTQLYLKMRSDIEAWKALVFSDGGGEPILHEGGEVESGERIKLPLEGAFSMVVLGTISLGNCWEGRGAFVLPNTISLKIEAPERAEPKEKVEIKLSGPAEGSVYFLVKESRLSTVDTPASAAAAALKRAIAKDLSDYPETGWVKRELSARLRGQDRGPAPKRATDSYGTNPRPQVTDMNAPAGDKDSVVFELDDLDDIFEENSKSSAALFGEVVEVPAEAAPLEPSVNIENRPAEVAPVGDMPAVLRAEVIALDAKGKATIKVDLDERMTKWTFEGFCVLGNSEVATASKLLASRDLHAELDMPEFIRTGDVAPARLHVHVKGGEATVSIDQDGQTVLLAHKAESGKKSLRVKAPGGAVDFFARPGRYTARLKTAAGEITAEGVVHEPGRSVWNRKAIQFLCPGEELDKSKCQAESIEVLRSLDAYYQQVIAGLIDYPHQCCEQTSAVLLGASAQYLSAQDSEARQAAEEHMINCIRAIKAMHLPGRGFKGWEDVPGNEVFCYSNGTTLNLLKLGVFEKRKLSKELRQNIDEAIKVARNAVESLRLEEAPAAPSSPRQAYERFRRYAGEDEAMKREQEKMKRYILEHIETDENGEDVLAEFDSPDMVEGTVYNLTPSMIRAQTAYAAALLVESGGAEVARGLRMANTVLDAIQENGSLYSTLDSVAALTLFSVCRRAGFAKPRGGAVAEINGKETDLKSALDKGVQIDAIKAIKDVVPVEVEQVVSEDWLTLDSGITPVARLLRTSTSRPHEIYELGEGIDLEIDLGAPYEAGDLVHVFLPDCLSWANGSKDTKHLVLDLKGQETVRLPLAATAVTSGEQGGLTSQRFIVVIRNMYDETRGKALEHLELIIREPRPS